MMRSLYTLLILMLAFAPNAVRAQDAMLESAVAPPVAEPVADMAGDPAASPAVAPPADGAPALAAQPAAVVTEGIYARKRELLGMTTFHPARRLAQLSNEWEWYRLPRMPEPLGVMTTIGIS